MKKLWTQKIVMSRKAYPMPHFIKFAFVISILMLGNYSAYAEDAAKEQVPTPFEKFVPNDAAKSILNQNAAAAAECKSDDPAYCIKADEASAISCETCPDCMKSQGKTCGPDSLADLNLELGRGNAAIKKGGTTKTTD